MELTLFDTLQELPLFQGFDRKSLNDIVSKTKLDFQKVTDKTVIISQDDPCTKLIFILSGTLTVKTTSNEHSYTLLEQVSAFYAIQPESLFGLYPRYTRTYIANGTTNLLCIEKKAIIEQFFQYEIFRFNLLNILCTQIQQAQRMLRKKTPQNIEKHFIHFIQTRSLRPAGEKKLLIKMTDLAEQLGETRLNVSKMLRTLFQKKLIKQERKQIIIPAFEKLLTENI